LDATTFAKATADKKVQKLTKTIGTAHNFAAANKLQKSKINVNTTKLLVFIIVASILYKLNNFLLPEAPLNLSHI
jgi:hypothetical protein